MKMAIRGLRGSWGWKKEDGQKHCGVKEECGQVREIREESGKREKK